MTEMPLVRRPLEFLEGHHDRQLLICVALERLAEEPGAADTPETARLVLEYFQIELPLHIADEEEDLFSRMRERCHEDDGFEETIAMLEAEHASDFDLHDRLMPVLAVLARGSAAEQHAVFARDAISFSTLQRRHLAWENGAVLPLARSCLLEADLEAMAGSMTRRRKGR